VRPSPPRRLELELTNVRLRIAVRDAGPDSPRRQPPVTDRESGRGLALLEALCADWGIDTQPTDGKRVWCDLAVG